MKAKVFSMMIGFAAVSQLVMAQSPIYKMNVKMTDGSFFSVAADDVEEVYFTTTEEHHFEDTYYTVSGRAEKGPFKSGSTVTMQPLDLRLNALGSAQITMTFDDCGNYAFRNTLFKYPYMSLSATGLFFNESDDYRTRDTQLTLQGYADLQHGSKVNVNVVTHLISERVANLVIGGIDFDVALSQAQGELLSAFGLQRLNDKDFAQVSITDGDDYAAALLAISMPLLYDRKGPDLISWMTRLRYDFADDGKFTEQNKVYAASGGFFIILRGIGDLRKAQACSGRQIVFFAKRGYPLGRSGFGNTVLLQNRFEVGSEFCGDRLIQTGENVRF